MRWPVVYHHSPSRGERRRAPLDSLKRPARAQHVEVVLEAVTDSETLCPITQEPIVDGNGLDWLVLGDDGGAMCPPAPSSYLPDRPELNSVVLECGHRFSVLPLVYHWVRSTTVKCPVCRRGLDGAHLRHATLPAHLRSALLQRVRREQRAEQREQVEADREAAQRLMMSGTLASSLSSSGDSVDGFHPGVFLMTAEYMEHQQQVRRALMMASLGNENASDAHSEAHSDDDQDQQQQQEEEEEEALRHRIRFPLLSSWSSSSSSFEPSLVRVDRQEEPVVDVLDDPERWCSLLSAILRGHVTDLNSYHAFRARLRSAAPPAQAEEAESEAAARAVMEVGMALPFEYGGTIPWCLTRVQQCRLEFWTDVMSETESFQGLSVSFGAPGAMLQARAMELGVPLPVLPPELAEANGPTGRPEGFLTLSATTGTARRLGLLISDRAFRIVAVTENLMFPGSRPYDPATDGGGDGDDNAGRLVDLSWPDSQGVMRYWALVRAGILYEVFFEVRLDAFCLLCMEQEELLRSVLLMPGPQIAPAILMTARY